MCKCDYVSKAINSSMGWLVLPHLFLFLLCFFFFLISASFVILFVLGFFLCVQ